MGLYSAIIRVKRTVWTLWVPVKTSWKEAEVCESRLFAFFQLSLPWQLETFLRNCVKLCCSLALKTVRRGEICHFPLTCTSWEIIQGQMRRHFQIQACHLEKKAAVFYKEFCKSSSVLECCSTCFSSKTNKKSGLFCSSNPHLLTSYSAWAAV